MSSKEATVVIAGPGAGKTHNMVEKVFTAIHSLKLNKFCCVITYTNAATDEIRNRISKKIDIPSNLFIGTIHSFINTFFIIPYYRQMFEINCELDFLQSSNKDILKLIGKQNCDFREKATITKRISDSFKKNGKITYDLSLDIANELIKCKKIIKLVSSRISFLFVDELQDINNKQLQILKKLIVSRKTESFLTGDPEQYISWFDNTFKSFDNIPFFKITNSKSIKNSLNINNWRSSKEIVDFINNFNHRIYDSIVFKQISKMGSTGIPVTFINLNIPNDLKNKFFNLIKTFSLNEVDYLILSKKNLTVNKFGVYDKNKSQQTEFFLTKISNILIESYDEKRVNFIKEYFNHNELTFRKFTIKIYKQVINDNFNLNTIVTRIGHSPKYVKNLKSIQKLEIKNVLQKINVSNIHNFKGREADAILLVAKSNIELKLWLETDMYKRDLLIKKSDKKDRELCDSVRVGYVGFSRARKLLCIACLEKLNNENKEKLKSLSVSFV